MTPSPLPLIGPSIRALLGAVALAFTAVACTPKHSSQPAREEPAECAHWIQNFTHHASWPGGQAKVTARSACASAVGLPLRLAGAQLEVFFNGRRRIIPAKTAEFAFRSQQLFILTPKFALMDFARGELKSPEGAYLNFATGQNEGLPKLLSTPTLALPKLAKILAKR